VIEMLILERKNPLFKNVRLFKEWWLWWRNAIYYRCFYV
jgi:hypothetical protein